MTGAKAEVLRYLGYQGQTLDSNLDDLVDTCMQQCRDAAAPRAIWRAYDVKLEADGVRLKHTAMTLPGGDIRAHLADAESVAVLAVTLGVAADTIIRRYEVADMTRSVILDACATQYIEEICDEYEEEIRDYATERGLALNFRYSPGYGDLPLDLQPDILALLDAGRRLGLTCTGSNILLPRKSVTAFIGLLPPEKAVAQKRGCDTCKLRETCNFRKDGGTGGCHFTPEG